MWRNLLIPKVKCLILSNCLIISCGKPLKLSNNQSFFIKYLLSYDKIFWAVNVQFCFLWLNDRRLCARQEIADVMN